MLEKHLATLLFFILDFQRARHYQPNLGELASYMGVTKVTVKKYVYALEKKIISRSYGMRAVISAGLR